MPDVHTQTPMTGNRIETVLKEIRALKNANHNRTHQRKQRANKRMVDQVGKRMAEHIVGTVQKTVRQSRKKVGSADPLAMCEVQSGTDGHGLAAAGRHDAVRHGGADLRRLLGRRSTRRSGSGCLLV